MSDLHYDPFYNTPQASSRHCRDGLAPALGQTGCDSPLALLQSAFTDAFAPERGAAYAVVTGDWLRHDMGSESAAAPGAIAQVAQLLKAFDGHIFPVPNLATALGNNDFVPDYFFNLTAPPPALPENFTNSLLANNLLREAERPSFARCGFFNRTVSPKLTVAVLNTVVWSLSLSPSEAPPGSDPCNQLASLRALFVESRAAARKVYIMAHMPPIINLWDVQFLHHAGSYYWQDQFTARYSALIREFNDVVAFQFFGHTHKFSWVGDLVNASGIPAFILPAISPVYDNNPSYFVATIDDTTFAVTDVYQRYLNGTVWVDGHDFVRDLFDGRSPITGEVLADAAIQLVTNDTLWAAYTEVYAGGFWTDQFNGEGCNATCRHAFQCSSSSIVPATVFACLTAPIPTEAPSASPIPTNPQSIGYPSRETVVAVSVSAAFLVAAVIGWGVYKLRTDITKAVPTQEEAAQQLSEA